MVLSGLHGLVCLTSHRRLCRGFVKRLRVTCYLDDVIVISLSGCFYQRVSTLHQRNDLKKASELETV